ncbi:MAG: type II toxin-antitoxin system RelE/ParE family toxin [Myxococcales bacterium]|nr:type II toxin-antitoxin system RelE/ParE family toxin [Myxococcales bacterium]
MAVVLYSARALEDLERLTEFISRVGPETSLEVARLITSAVSVLERHPLIGRPTEHGLRELVISRGRTGYVALYRFHPRRDSVWILCLRHQREAGYPDE